MKYEKCSLEKVGRFFIDRRRPLENRTAPFRSVKSILSTACRPPERSEHNPPTAGGHNPRGEAPSTLTPKVCPMSQNHLFPPRIADNRDLSCPVISSEAKRSREISSHKIPFIGGVYVSRHTASLKSDCLTFNHPPLVLRHHLSARSSVGLQKESALMGRLGALLRPTWRSYAGPPQWHNKTPRHFERSEAESRNLSTQWLLP